MTLSAELEGSNNRTLRVPDPVRSIRKKLRMIDSGRAVARCGRLHAFSSADRCEAAAVELRVQTNVYVERLGDRYRWSLIHRGGPYPLLWITAMNKWPPTGWLQGCGLPRDRG